MSSVRNPRRETGLRRLATKVVSMTRLEEGAATVASAASVAMTIEVNLQVMLGVALSLTIGAVGIGVAVARALPRIMAWSAVAIVAVAPAYWLSSQAGILGGLGALLWLALSSGWMMMRGFRVHPHRSPEPGKAYAFGPDPTLAFA